MSLAQQGTLDGLYLESLKRYEEYLQEGGVFRTMLAMSGEMVEQENARLKLFYSFILVILSLGIISFAILYIRYLNKLCGFTSSLFDLPESTMIALQMEL